MNDLAGGGSCDCRGADEARRGEETLFLSPPSYYSHSPGYTARKNRMAPAYWIICENDFLVLSRVLSTAKGVRIFSYICLSQSRHMEGTTRQAGGKLEGDIVRVHWRHWISLKTGLSHTSSAALDACGCHFDPL